MSLGSSPSAALRIATKQKRRRWRRRLSLKLSRESHSEPTPFIKKSKYDDPKSTKEEPRWQLVDIAFAGKFDRVVTLAELKEEAALQDMLVVQRGQRLSIQPVDKVRFKRVLAMAGATTKVR